MSVDQTILKSNDVCCLLDHRYLLHLRLPNIVCMIWINVYRWEQKWVPNTFFLSYGNKIRSLKECDSQWWDAFVNEFFEDDATVTISICLEDGPKRFSMFSLLPIFSKSFFSFNQGINRVLIPRFFRTLFDGGVNEVYFQLKQTKEIFHNPILSLDSEQASMITCFGKPPYIKVQFNSSFPSIDCGVCFS